jgi:benzoyl-CoA reductase/2-hydroxyglutaryl-CoA dehydratase subunit BcrC/BadD/HgdB
MEEQGRQGTKLSLRFENMVENCLEYATAAKAQGRPVVGIMCEYTPRELIMAAGGVPVCLCGGAASTIPAAEHDLPANICPLIKSTYGYHILKKNPFLEMADLLVAETTCDGKKKMYELLAQSRPMHVLELPQRPDRREGMENWYRELLRLKAELESRFHVRVTDDNIRRAIAVMNRERRLRRQLAASMKVDSPGLTGRELLDLKSLISGIEEDLQEYQVVVERLKTRQSPRGDGSSVRVLLTGVPLAHGAERVLDIIESSGGLVVCMENCTGLKPILDDVDESTTDPILALAEKYYTLPCSVMSRNDRRLETLRGLIHEYRPQCVVELIWQACLTYDVESYFVRHLAHETGLPYLRIETDYSPSDSARIAVRAEALFETVRGRSGVMGK